MLLAAWSASPGPVLTAGVLVGAGSMFRATPGIRCSLARTGYVRRRGLAMSIAFSGRQSAIVLLPWVQTFTSTGRRAGCTAMGLTGVGAAGADKPCCSGGVRKTLDSGRWRPHGERLLKPPHPAKRLDKAGRLSIGPGPACGRQGSGGSRQATRAHGSLYPCRSIRQGTWSEVGFFPGAYAAWAPGSSASGHSRPDCARHVSDRIGREWVWTVGAPALRCATPPCC